MLPPPLPAYTHLDAHIFSCVCVFNVQVLRESSLQFSGNLPDDRRMAITTSTVCVCACIAAEALINSAVVSLSLNVPPPFSDLISPCWEKMFPEMSVPSVCVDVKNRPG